MNKIPARVETDTELNMVINLLQSKKINVWIPLQKTEDFKILKGQLKAGITTSNDIEEVKKRLKWTDGKDPTVHGFPWGLSQLALNSETFRCLVAKRDRDMNDRDCGFQLQFLCTGETKSQQQMRMSPQYSV